MQATARPATCPTSPLRRPPPSPAPSLRLPQRSSQCTSSLTSIAALVLRSTASLRAWYVPLLCLLVADLGHLSTMIPSALEKRWVEVFGRFWAWDAMMWGSVGFVYVGASMTTAFLLALGLGKDTKAKED